MLKRLLAVSGTTTAAALVLLVGGSTAAHAQAVPVSSGPNTFNATSDDGTGAMTSSAEVAGPGGADDEHANRVEQDNYGQVGAFLQVEAGTYNVTVTVDNAVADETASGTATARGFVEVTIEVYLPQGSQLTVNVKLHSFVSAYTDTVDTASVQASAAGTTVEITRVGDAAPGPTPPPGDEEPRKKKCLAIFCL